MTPLEVTRKALELGLRQATDPLAFAVYEQVTLANAFFAARQYATAVEHAQRALTLDPNSWAARATLGRTFVEMARYADAIIELEEAWRVSQRLPALAGSGTRMRKRGAHPKRVASSRSSRRVRTALTCRGIRLR